MASERGEDRLGAPAVVDELSRADALLDLGRPRDALVVAAQVLAADPGSTDALLLAGRCHLQLGEAGHALSAARTALAGAPLEPGAWVLTSLAYTAAGDAAQAVRHAEQAIAQWPQLPGGHWALAAARMNGGRHRGQARASAARVVDMQPLDPDSHVLAAQAEMYPGRLRPGPAARGRARMHLRRALELEPTHLEARQELAVLAAMGWGFSRGMRGSAEALRESPFDQAPLGAIAYIFRRIIWLVHTIIILAFFGCVFGSAAGSVVAMRASAGVAGLVMMLLLANICWQLGRSVGAHLRAFPRRDWSGAAWIGCLIVAVVCLNMGSWFPRMVSMLVLAKILIWVGAALSWIPRKFET